jgi:hypothetical protein
MYNIDFFFFQTEPYTMYKENSEVLEGNGQFEGFNIDLIDAISKILRKTPYIDT